jgi:hypothetical protein
MHYLVSSDSGKFSHEIFQNIYRQIVEAKLPEDLQEIRVVTVGNKTDLKTDFSTYEKVFHVNHVNDRYSYEFPTLEKMASDASEMNDDDQILYMHLKNASKPSLINKKCEWTQSMLNCVVHSHETCRQKLAHHNSVGTRFSEAYKVKNKVARNYSGNFWWTTASHVKNLPYPSKENLMKTHGFLVDFRKNKNPSSPSSDNWRYLPELWVCLLDMDETHKMCGL